MRNKRWVVLGVLVAASASAQAPQPSVTPFPLELKRKPAGFSAADAEEVQKDFLRLLRKAGPALPDTSSLEGALKQLKRQDCEREDGCLQQLAQQGKTLYGLYVSVDFTLDGAVVASGRVVRDDGKLVSPLQTVTLPKSTDGFRDVVKVALVRLFERLELAKLPAVRPVEAPIVVKDAPKKEPELVAAVPPSPPPLVVERRVSGAKIAGWTMVGVGAVAVGVGGAVLAVADPQLNEIGVIVPKSMQSAADAVASYRSAKTQQTLGGVVAGVGGALAVGGLVMVLMTGDAPAVSVVPVNGGAMVSIGGSIP